MPVAAYRERTEEAQPMPALRRPDRFPPNGPPLGADGQALCYCAHDVAAAADHRVAACKARLACRESQVTTDERTGLYNHRGFLRAFAHANTSGQGTPPSSTILVVSKK